MALKVITFIIQDHVQLKATILLDVHLLRKVTVHHVLHVAADLTQLLHAASRITTVLQPERTILRESLTVLRQERTAHHLKTIALLQEAIAHHQVVEEEVLPAHHREGRDN